MGPGQGEAAEEAVLAELTGAELVVIGRLTGASNVAFLARAGERHAIYKPVAGERPLWDFADGTLAGREVAAYLISAAGGWDLVPPTVLRDGPAGAGSVQLWIGPVPGESGRVGLRRRDPGLIGIVRPGDLPDGWHAVVEGELGDGTPVLVVHADDARLRSLAVLDAVLNNSDRKGSHVLAGCGERIWGIDNGLCLSAEPKLRTVLWGWAGDRLPPGDAARCRRLAAALHGTAGEVLAGLITGAELAALRARLELLVTQERHPAPTGNWPALPWPPV